MLNRGLKLISIFAIALFILFTSCKGRTPSGIPEPVDLIMASTRADTDIVDLQAISGKTEFGQGNLPPIGHGNAIIESIEGISVDEGVLILKSDTRESLTSQQTSEDLKVNFEMWIAAGEAIHEDNPSLIAVGEPNLTWKATVHKVGERIDENEVKEVYNFNQEIENLLFTNDTLSNLTKSNYTTFVKATLKDSDELVAEKSVLSIKNLSLNVNAFGFPKSVKLTEPSSEVIEVNLVAIPKTIQEGETVTLYIVAIGNLKSLLLNNGTGNTPNFVKNVTSFVQITDKPKKSTTYTLNATSKDGVKARVSTSITVLPADTLAAVHD